MAALAKASTSIRVKPRAATRTSEASEPRERSGPPPLVAKDNDKLRRGLAKARLNPARDGGGAGVPASERGGGRGGGGIEGSPRASV